jgi:RimJ/RimL family protein N-acetyltransferase
MKIRHANKFDYPFFFEVLQKYQKRQDLAMPTINDLIELKEEYISKLFHHIILGGGVALIVEDEGKNCGIIVGTINSQIWDPKLKMLNHIIIWTEPEYRNTTAALSLLRAYGKHGKKLIEEGKIIMFTISKAFSLNKFDLSKLGYSKAEETWSIGI